MLRILAVTLLAAATVGAADLAPEEIQAALDAGAKAKKLRAIEIKRGRVSCVATTPVLRIQLAAYSAKKEYKTFSAADVTEEMLAPFIEIACPSMKVLGASNELASVRAMVIVPKDGAPIQPTKSDAMPENYMNAYGASWDAAGMVAQFPAEAVKVGSELHVVFTKKVAYSVVAPPKDDIGIEIKDLSGH